MPLPRADMRIDVPKLDSSVEPGRNPEIRPLPKRTISLHDTEIMHRCLAKYPGCKVRRFDLVGKMKHPLDLHSAVDQIPVKGSNVLPWLGHCRLSALTSDPFGPRAAFCISRRRASPTAQALRARVRWRRARRSRDLESASSPPRFRRRSWPRHSV